jgi:hypothetical protein
MVDLVGGGGGGGGSFDYVQDTEPADPSDSESWVDTSDPARTVYVYSADRGEFVPTYEAVPLFVTQEAVTFQETEVQATYSGTHPEESIVLGGPIDTVPRAADQADTYGSPFGVCFNPNQSLYAIEGVLSSMTANRDSREVQLRLFSDNSIITTTTPSNGEFRIEEPLSAGTEYAISLPAPTSSDYIGYNYDLTTPITGESLDITGDYNDGAKNAGRVYGVSELTGVGETTTGTASVSFDMPDIAAWDRISWGYDKQAGSVSFDVETDDGTGWSTYATDVLPPVSLGSVPPDTDVRLVASLSRPSTGDASPRVTYVARRGER